MTRIWSWQMFLGICESNMTRQCWISVVHDKYFLGICKFDMAQCKQFWWLLRLTCQRNWLKWQLLSLTIYCRILTWIRLLKSFTILTLEELEVLTWQLFWNLKDLTWQRKLLNFHCTWQTLKEFDRSDKTTKPAEFLLYMTTFFRNLVDLTWIEHGWIFAIHDKLLGIW